MTTLEKIVGGFSGLIATIDRARYALDTGDVQSALLLAGGAYAEAQAAADFAKKLKASHELIGKARQMQADALKIESMCTIAMADLVDDAQAAGKLSRGGRPGKVQDQDRFSLLDLGIDKRRLLEARQLRNVERARPGFIDRIVAARLAEGLEPSRASLRKAAGHAIGTKTRTEEEPGADAYFTPAEAMSTLLALESFSVNVLEPACGNGAISRPMEAVGYDLDLADIIDRQLADKHGRMQRVEDFTLSRPLDHQPDIVTNPPYGKHVLNRFVAHALRVHRPRKMALLLNLNFMCGCEDPDRIFAMEEHPPSRIYVFTRRLPMMHQEGWDGPEAASQMNTAWFVWEMNEDGSYGNVHPQIIRVDWQHFLASEPLLPGAGGHVLDPKSAERFVDNEFARETPRRSVEERVEEELARALVFAAECGEGFDAGTLRRGIAVRPIVGDALIADMAKKGLIDRLDAQHWTISERGQDVLAATAAVLAGAKIPKNLEMGVV